ncbi:unnamed protein product [Symbiodinium necroappetens]|uniref:Uncharacterized protein n=1 Tax=Symbiodinium necroappetens TaxID=1628268 RepID=A0A812WR34_9DINO|nr:unnamed protein product [Symbiodinium necroappetens]
MLLSRAPLTANVLLSGTTVELECDAYTKAEADGRYLPSSDFTTLDTRYEITNANVSYTSLVRDGTQQVRALLARAPLTANVLFRGYALAGALPADPLLVNDVQTNGAS